MGASCCVVRVTVFFRLVRVTVPSILIFVRKNKIFDPWLQRYYMFYYIYQFARLTRKALFRFLNLFRKKFSFHLLSISSRIFHATLIKALVNQMRPSWAIQPLNGRYGWLGIRENTLERRQILQKSWKWPTLIMYFGKNFAWQKEQKKFRRDWKKPKIIDRSEIKFQRQKFYVKYYQSGIFNS